jgi:uncharacterized protein
MPRENKLKINRLMLIGSIFLIFLSASFASSGLRTDYSRATSTSNITQVRQHADSLINEDIEVVLIAYVNSVFPELGGFFMQALDRKAEIVGIFVEYRGEDIFPGLQVSVSAKVAKKDGRVYVIAHADKLVRLDAHTPPRAKNVSIQDLISYPQMYLGRLVQIRDDVVLCDTYNLARYGQTLISAERCYTGSNWKDADKDSAPGSGPMFKLDDGSSKKNPGKIPFVSAGKHPRVGDRIKNLTGVVDFLAGDFCLQPVGKINLQSDTREADSPEKQADIRVASFNVLNYFTTLGERGADSREELNRQQQKLLSAIDAMNADVLGLMEVENNGEKSLKDLLKALNTNELEEDKAGDWKAVASPKQGTGNDAIRVAIAYRSSLFTETAAPLGTKNPAMNRPALSATLMQQSSGEIFSLIVSHLKSKGCRNAKGKNADSGQGCWNAKRIKQAKLLVKFADKVARAAKDPDVLLIGDFNSCAGEDPIMVLEDAGYRQLLDDLAPKDRYTYVYKGRACALDNALCNSSLDKQITGINIWHINADEARVFDYNLEGRRPGLFTVDPFRSSDHDPLLIDLQLR